jgi:hypothetical protein
MRKYIGEIICTPDFRMWLQKHNQGVLLLYPLKYDESSFVYLVWKRR